MDKDKDREILDNLSDREEMIADAATRIAYRKAGDWLAIKQAKSEQFPGVDVEYAKGRASAYSNASQEIYMWAMREYR